MAKIIAEMSRTNPQTSVANNVAIDKVTVAKVDNHSIRNGKPRLHFQQHVAADHGNRHQRAQQCSLENLITDMESTRGQHRHPMGPDVQVSLRQSTPTRRPPTKYVNHGGKGSITSENIMTSNFGHVKNSILQTPGTPQWSSTTSCQSWEMTQITLISIDINHIRSKITKMQDAEVLR